MGYSRSTLGECLAWWFLVSFGRCCRWSVLSMSHSTPPTVAWYTTSEAMTRLGCSEATIKRRINAGDLQAKTENRRRLILLPISADNATALVAVEQSAMFAQLLATERDALQLTRQTCLDSTESAHRAVRGWQVAAGLLLCVSIAGGALTITADRARAVANEQAYRASDDRDTMRGEIVAMRARLEKATRNDTMPTYCDEEFVVIPR